MQRTSKIYFVKSVLYENFGNFVWINCCRTCSLFARANALFHQWRICLHMSFHLLWTKRRRREIVPTQQQKRLNFLMVCLSTSGLDDVDSKFIHFVQAKRKKIRERKLWLQNACTSYWHSGMNLPYFCFWTVVICVHERLRSLQPNQWPANILFSHKLFLANQFCH